ncbi:MAG: sigma 54-interacting transcriptional regulator [Desulfobacteraceae bacterium]|jgi:transcriptional regulator with GAF, ATPase, and Fis domain
MIDENIFFREATLLICGSLEIERALWKSLLYIRKYIPADMIFLNIYNRDTGIGESLAKADLKGGQLTSLKLLLPEAARNIIEEYQKNPNEKANVLAFDRSSDPLIMESLSIISSDPNVSFIAFSPVPKWNLFCSILIGNHMGERYTEEHINLLSLLNEPMAIAMSNYLRYRELLRLKDILMDDNRYLQSELMQNLNNEIIGTQYGLQQVMKMAIQVAPLISPVLLLGETGTGKEVMATAIHNLSPRRDGPFIKVNCGAIPESLMDSELFGHEKGAFTGAFGQKRGRFERANGGTIFLDEIGELPLGAQVRLLRILQEKELERVGGTETINVDIRIIAATHSNIEKLITEGKFRQDLYFRLCVFPITIPPLRERLTDIPILVHHFIKKKAQEMGKVDIPLIASGAIQTLMDYSWPGNVRELQNVVERALILSDGESLSFDNIDIQDSSKDTIFSSVDTDALDFNMAVTKIITRALEQTNGRIEGENGAAKLLNLNPSTLRTKMRKLGIPFGKKFK